MSGIVFFDTNILVYYLTHSGRKMNIAGKLIQHGGSVSVQIMNELVAVLNGKMKLNWQETESALEVASYFFPNPTPLSMVTHQNACRLAKQHRFHIYDCLILASAIEAGCDTLYTEDLQDGQTIDGVRIVNPFLHSK